MSRIYDISVPVRTGGLVYPGNPEIAIELQQAVSRGAGANVSSIHFGSHTGTHVDAARHFFDDGEPVDKIDLGVLIGRCVVLAFDDGIPAVTAADLEKHDCVMLAAKNNEAHWDLVSGRRKARVRVAGPVSSRDFNTASTFVVRGHGIGLLPQTHCDEHIARGRLVRLLPKWTSLPNPVFAVYQSRKYLPLRLSVFLEALAAWRSPLWIKDSAQP